MLVLSTVDGNVDKYDITLTLNHEEIEKHLETISKIKSITDKHNWKDINYPSRKDGWIIFENNNPTFVNVLYAKEGRI